MVAAGKILCIQEARPCLSSPAETTGVTHAFRGNSTDVLC